ncbi:MAG: hypothetical protein QM820_02690 [Minicystis sp.]
MSPLQSPPRQSSLQMTLDGMLLSRSFLATARTFSLPKMASSQGAKATRGGIRGRPKVAVARSMASAGVGPSKTWIFAGTSISTRAALGVLPSGGDSEQRAKIDRRSVSVVRMYPRLDRYCGMGAWLACRVPCRNHAGPYAS